MCKTRTLINKNQHGALSRCACAIYRFSFHHICWELNANEYKNFVQAVKAVRVNDWELNLNRLNWHVIIPLDFDGIQRKLCCDRKEYEALSFLLIGYQKNENITPYQTILN